MAETSAPSESPKPHGKLAIVALAYLLILFGSVSATRLGNCSIAGVLGVVFLLLGIVLQYALLTMQVFFL